MHLPTTLSPHWHSLPPGHHRLLPGLPRAAFSYRPFLNPTCSLESIPTAVRILFCRYKSNLTTLLCSEIHCHICAGSYGWQATASQRLNTAGTRRQAHFGETWDTSEELWLEDFPVASPKLLWTTWQAGRFQWIFQPSVRHSGSDLATAGWVSQPVPDLSSFSFTLSSSQ